jgi:predicted esterase YcpF (UPF0227 family)
MKSLLIYIHGFLSSPLSQKAVELGDYLQAQGLDIDYQVPALSNYPAQALSQLQQLIAASLPRYSRIALVGSSMGGFYASVLAEQYGLRAVLVNPVVHAHRLIAGYLGEHRNPYTNEHFCLTNKDLQQLQLMQPQTIKQPDHYWLMVQTADETLDYRQAVDFYRDSPQLVESGGNHRFENFKKHCPALLKFLELA